MNVLLNLLNDQTIESVPLSFLGELLCDFDLISKASNVEQVTLLTRITTLLRSNHTQIRWRATRLFQLVVRHPALLLNSNHITNCIASLIKIMESKCFIENEQNPSQHDLICLRATVESLDFAMDRIRGKANLTREVLTPKISGIIGGLIGLVRILPNEVIPVLYKLILCHSNTFRPFGAKLEKEILTILASGENINKLNPSVLTSSLKCLALLSFNLSRTDISEQWSQRMNDLIVELRSVLTLYESLLDLETNPVYKGKMKLSATESQKGTNHKYLFGSLDIDVNENPLSIRQASDRINLLLLLIQAQLEISTPNTVAVPIGELISLTTLLVNLPTLTNVQAGVRGEELHSAISDSLLSIQYASLKTLINFTRIFSADLYPHMYDILATMDSSIPVLAKNGKLYVNKALVLKSKDNISLIIDLASQCLGLTERWSDMSILTRIVDSSFILTESFQLPNPASIPTAGAPSSSALQHQSSKKKNGKKSTISFSDYLSAPKSFLEFTSKKIMVVIRDFFKILVTKCELSTGKLNTIVRWSILDALNGGLKEDKKLLEYIALYPGKSKGSISAYPMIVSLLEGSQSEIISLLMNPRLPLIPQLGVSLKKEREEFEDDSEEETVEAKPSDESELEKVDIGSDLKRKLEDEIEVSEKKIRIDTEYTSLVVSADNQESVEKMKSVVFEAVIPATDEKVSETVEEAPLPMSDDEEMGSDFEIPEINVD